MADQGFLHLLFQLFKHPDEVIKWGGYPLLMAIIFSETGLLVGFFLPGDSLLVTAGVLVGTGLVNPFDLPPVTNLLLLNGVLMVMAIVGDATGFWFGAKTGPVIFTREQSLFFRRDYLLQAKAYYDEHGGKTIILARFMPFLRTFAPIVAGVAGMPYRRFALFNVTGGVAWVGSMLVLGFVVGQRLEPKRIEQIVIAIVIISVLPPVIGFLRGRAKAKAKQAAAGSGA